MLVRFFCLFFALLVTVACSVALPQNARRTERADLGEAVTVRPGTPIAVATTDLTVTFSQVLSDGRCPVGVSCTATLPVDVAIDVRDRTGAANLTLSAYTGGDGNVIVTAPNLARVQEYAGYAIALEQVLPYPSVDGASAPDSYRVKLRITRAGPPEPVARPPGSVPARFDEPVALSISQTAVYHAPNARITVTGVTDNRCPPLTICEELPIVVVDLTVLTGDETWEVSVGGVTDDTGHVTGSLMESRGIPWAQAGSLSIELTAVTPYPQWRAETDPDKYAVTLVVTASGLGKPTPALPMATPAPTAVPTADSDIPVLSFDAAGNPLLCVSERALVELAAGGSDAAPVGGTPLPIGAVSLPSQAAADEICGMFFGDAWRVATTSDLTLSYESHLPAAGVFWIWDSAADAVIAWEAGQ